MNVRTLMTRAQQQAGRVDPGYDARTLRALNDAQEKWALTIPWPGLVRHERFVADGTTELVLPPRVRKIQWLADKTNKKPLDVGGQWDRQFPAPFLDQTSGAAALWRDLGVVPVIRQPSVPSRLSVVAGASDNFTVHITGLAFDTAASGTPLERYFVEDLISVNSTTGHTSTNEYVQVDSYGKDDLTPGDVSLRSVDGVMARLAKNKYRSELRRIELLFKPAAGTLIECEYLTAPQPLASDPQVPHPAVDVEYLVWYAAGVIHRNQNQADLAQEAFAQAEVLLNTRIYQERMHGDTDIQSIPDAAYWGNEDQYGANV